MRFTGPCRPGLTESKTAYPLMALNKNPELFIHCLDYSRQAIALVQVRTKSSLSRPCLKRFV